MKKEWVYFIAGAGAGLIATVIFFSMPKYENYNECVIREGAKLHTQSKYYYGNVYEYCEGY